MAGEILYTAENEQPSDSLDKFMEWYAWRHVPDVYRLGFLTCASYRAVEGGFNVLGIYELKSVSIFETPGYKNVQPKDNYQPPIVARVADVAVGSVSRALNGHPDLNAGLRERILTAARELGYTPLRKRRTNAQPRRGGLGAAAGKHDRNRGQSEQEPADHGARLYLDLTSKPWARRGPRPGACLGGNSGGTRCHDGTG